MNYFHKKQYNLLFKILCFYAYNISTIFIFWDIVYSTYSDESYLLQVDGSVKTWVPFLFLRYA